MERIHISVSLFVFFLLACVVNGTTFSHNISSAEDKYITCYLCVSGMECQDPFDSTHDDLSTCVGLACTKFKTEYNGVSSIIRGCSADEKAEIGCITQSESGITTYSCYCNRDRCNGAEVNKAITNMALILPTISLIYKLFS